MPRESFFRILTPPPVQWDVDATVDKLFWVDSKQWNVQLLNDLFSPEEVTLIRVIRLGLRDTIDHRIWNYDRYGKFTVRSAYHVARGLLGTSGEGVVGSSSSNVVGEKLWKACVPGKVINLCLTGMFGFSAYKIKSLQTKIDE